MSPQARKRMPLRASSSRGETAADGIRINRFLSMCGIASRRKAEELVEAGRVKVNRKIVRELGSRVDPARDTVSVDDKVVSLVQEQVYLVLNKPKDAITTLSDERGRRTVMNLFRSRHRVFPIGRLDRDTTGVLLFTNDGEFAHRLMHPRYEVQKTYRVTCSKAVSREHLMKLAAGVNLEDGVTAETDIYVPPATRGKEIIITLHEGRNRQVRRMFESLEYEVTKLDRLAYGPITCEGLARGETRSLSRREVRKLRELAGMETESGEEG
jgi:23S rRNA pseudouridine2605 synthase